VIFGPLRAKRGNLQLLWGSYLEITTARKVRFAMTIAAFFNSLLIVLARSTDKQNMGGVLSGREVLSGTVSMRAPVQVYPNLVRWVPK